MAAASAHSVNGEQGPEQHHEAQVSKLHATRTPPEPASAAPKGNANAYAQAAVTPTPLNQLGHESALIDCPACTERNWTLTQDTEDDCGMFYVSLTLISLAHQ